MWTSTSASASDLTKELFSTTTSAIPEYHAVTNDKGDAPKDYALQNPSVNPALSENIMPDKEYQKSRGNNGKRAGIIAIAALALYSLFGVACKSDNTIYEKILVTTNAASTLNGGQTSGDANYQGNGITNTKPFGVQADLGSTPKNTTKPFTVKLYGDNALPRYFNSVNLGGTVAIDTDVLDLNNFDLQGFLDYFNYFDNTTYPYWKNPRLNVRNIKFIFNPNRTTGERLPKEYIDGVKQSVLEMQQDSDGFIQSVEFVENGNKPDDATVPPDGEFWVFHVTDLPSSVGNISYPQNGDQVKSGKLFYNPYKTLPGATWHETKDVFFQGEEGQLPSDTTRETLRTFYRFSFHRQAGNGYTISLECEQQPGLDDFTTMTQGSSYAFTKTSTIPFNNPLGPGDGFDGAVSRRDAQRTPPRNDDRHERAVKKIEKN